MAVAGLCSAPNGNGGGSHAAQAGCPCAQACPRAAAALFGPSECCTGGAGATLAWSSFITPHVSWKIRVDEGVYRARTSAWPPSPLRVLSLSAGSRRGTRGPARCPVLAAAPNGPFTGLPSAGAKRRWRSTNYNVTAAASCLQPADDDWTLYFNATACQLCRLAMTQSTDGPQRLFIMVSARCWMQNLRHSKFPKHPGDYFQHGTNEEPRKRLLSEKTGSRESTESSLQEVVWLIQKFVRDTGSEREW
ncbi:uncharacterized protein [Dermacentor albipictus]|uniref:uncharacterized protein n=1 Tax=Dermacentor albipictus TaxID=60249 RepID=UPI0031FD49DE